MEARDAGYETTIGLATDTGRQMQHNTMGQEQQQQWQQQVPRGKH